MSDSCGDQIQIGNDSAELSVHGRGIKDLRVVRLGLKWDYTDKHANYGEPRVELPQSTRYMSNRQLESNFVAIMFD